MTLTKTTHWIRAIRLRTLPLSVSGIIVGCGLAHFMLDTHPRGLIQLECFGCVHINKNYFIFFYALLTTIGFQVLSNLANDYGDGVKGTDDNREGEQRLVASGIITPQKMKRAMIITGLITLASSVILIFNAFGKENYFYLGLFFGLGILSIIAAIRYTVGKKPYGYSGYGDVFVFLFFGWLSVVGSNFLYTKEINWHLFLPATTIGLLSVAVLNLNNMRDCIPDKKAGKNTLVVVFGKPFAKKYHYFLITGAFICALWYSLLYYKTPTQFICFVAFIPLFYNLKIVTKNSINKSLDSELKKVALSTFLFAILFSIFN